MPMVETVVPEFLKHGLLGLGLLGMCAIIGFLTKDNLSLRKENAAIRDERIKDAKLYSEELLRRNNDWHEFKRQQEEFLERLLRRPK
jgi:hypothetical protein